jgi:hypothetical protein
MEDHKFKVGDKVVLTASSWGSINVVGDVGFITKADIYSSRVSVTNDLLELNNWHPNTDIKLYVEEYFTINELKLNLGDVVKHSMHDWHYTMNPIGLRAPNGVYLNNDYFGLGKGAYIKGFKVISRAKSKTETKEEKTMTNTSKFLETVTVTSSFIKESIDSQTDGAAFISIKPNITNSRIELVIGAEFEKRRRPFFTKDNLSKLIEDLKAVHSVMV